MATDKRGRSAHYVNNKLFFEAMVEYRTSLKETQVRGLPPPPVSEYIGECLLSIARHLSYKGNFANYAFREDMVSDGIENSLQYIGRFDPEISQNPFSYFTQIIFYAFLRRIMREKKQLYIKYKIAENTILHDEAANNVNRYGDEYSHNLMLDFMKSFEDARDRPKRRKSKPEVAPLI